jgi:DNA-binding MarR family transcriptional regulator
MRGVTAFLDPVDALMASWRAELPDVLNPASELTKRVMLLAAELDEATRRELPGVGLTVAEFDVIVALRRAGSPYRLKPNTLARSLMLSTGGTSNVTNRLVSRQLVVREGDPNDARSTWIRLTPEGVRLAEHAVRVNSTAHATVFAGVPVDVIDAAAAALRDVFAAAAGGRRGGALARRSRAHGPT